MGQALLKEIWGGQRRACLILGWLIVLNLVVYLALQWWGVPLVAERENQFIQRQTVLRQSVQQGSRAEAPGVVFDRAQKDLTGFYTQVPLYAEFTGLIDELMTLASMSKLELNAIRYTSKPLETLPLQQYGVTFTVTGSYDQVKRFVHALEQSPRVMALKNIGLQYTDSERRSGVSLRLSLETYFRSGEVSS